jgi:hypothetical protein
MHTFSGTHDWHPSVLIDTDADEHGNADFIIESIESGRCPRCEGSLPAPPEYPAGSRITQCRSIPICGPCGSDEAYEAIDGGISSAGCWPIDRAEISERRSRREQQMVTAIFTGDGHLVTQDGSTPVVIPGNTGGWAQYGAAAADSPPPSS